MFFQNKMLIKLCSETKPLSIPPGLLTNNIIIRHPANEHTRDSPKFNVLCAVPHKKIVQSFCAKCTVTGVMTYRFMLVEFSMPIWEEEGPNDILLQPLQLQFKWTSRIKGLYRNRIEGALTPSHVNPLDLHHSTI